MGTNENTKDGLVGETDKGWKISKKEYFLTDISIVLKKTLKLQGVSLWRRTFYQPLTGRNMYVRPSLKVVLDSWDVGIYENIR